MLIHFRCFNDLTAEVVRFLIRWMHGERFLQKATKKTKIQFGFLKKNLRYLRLLLLIVVPAEDRRGERSRRNPCNPWLKRFPKNCKKGLDLLLWLSLKACSPHVQIREPVPSISGRPLPSTSIITRDKWNRLRRATIRAIHPPGAWLDG